MTALRLLKGSFDNQKKDYINRVAQSEPRTGVLFADFIENTITRKSKRMSESYARNYNSLLRLLRDFANEFNVNIYTNSVNEEFLDDFITYLEEKGYKLSYIKYQLTLIKGMVRRASTYGYAVNPSFDDVDLGDEDSFSVYLSMNDITRIYYYEGLTRIQSKWRDLFVVGCLTGLRYSDYSTLRKENFNGDYIVKVTKKTGAKVSIPIHDYVREIYEKYDGELPTGLSIQTFNEHLKNICKKIGFNEKVTFSYTKGGKVITETKQKWELISSHSARRSFATNAYLTNRLEPFKIMAITGHTTEKSFFRYIKVTKEDLIKQIANDNFFKK